MHACRRIVEWACGARMPGMCCAHTVCVCVRKPHALVRAMGCVRMCGGRHHCTSTSPSGSRRHRHERLQAHNYRQENTRDQAAPRGTKTPLWSRSSFRTFRLSDKASRLPRLAPAGRSGREKAGFAGRRGFRGRPRLRRRACKRRPFIAPWRRMSNDPRAAPVHKPAHRGAGPPRQDPRAYGPRLPAEARGGGVRRRCSRQKGKRVKERDVR
jgi:hypothetical protein